LFDVSYSQQSFNTALVSYADDGGGMDPSSIRKCMSLGYSSKKSKTTIGQCIWNYFIHFFNFFCTWLKELYSC